MSQIAVIFETALPAYRYEQINYITIFNDYIKGGSVFILFISVS